MNYADTAERLKAYRGQIETLRHEMRALQAEVEPDPVEDYHFRTTEGEVTLSELFGDKPELFVIHNMGRGCSYCTLWADGFNGVSEHLASRAAFVVSSPDDPETQAAFKASRNWRFRMVSHQGSSFAEDMGYRRDQRYWPGVSVFRKTGTGIVRLSDAGFEPGDDFCPTWHLFDLLPEGANGWQPKYRYAQEAA
ncbi:MAG TPA: DUF899 family protein [Alphaproteobacteria bacterium]|nr:DUF899 family protein [Alphaproteobacteria bacterium]